MTNDIDLNDAFTKTLMARVPKTQPSYPLVFQNHDGDCIEVLVSNDSYRAERVDSLVTVYVNRENGELVGVLIKGVGDFIQSMVERFPGFKVDIVDRKVKLECLFTANLWSKDSGGNLVRVQTYKRLRQMAENADIEIDTDELQQA